MAKRSATSPSRSRCGEDSDRLPASPSEMAPQSRPRREEVPHGLPAPPSDMAAPSLPPRPPTVKPREYPEHDMPPGLTSGSLPPGGFLGPPLGFRLSSLHQRNPNTPPLMTGPPSALPPRTDANSFPCMPWSPHPGAPGVHPPPGVNGPPAAYGAPPIPGMTGPPGAPGAAPFLGVNGPPPAYGAPPIPGMNGPPGAPGAAPFPVAPGAAPYPGVTATPIAPGVAPFLGATLPPGAPGAGAPFPSLPVAPSDQRPQLLVPLPGEGGAPIHCSTCNRNFATMEALTDHCRSTTKHDIEVGPHVTFNGQDYNCNLCGRFFNTRDALLMHLRNSTRHLWCERCKHVFPDQASMLSHLHNSSKHHICNTCEGGFDFEHEHEHIAHDVAVHNYCPECGNYFDTAELLQQHQMRGHMFYCEFCGIPFRSENQMLIHRVTHLPRNLVCPGCPERFRQFSAILKHLEDGACASGYNEFDVDEIARMFYRSREYVMVDNTGGWTFKCPGCSVRLGFLSRVYQHAENTGDCRYLLSMHGCLSDLSHFIGGRIPWG